jgi:nucleotide-binding universal stress UspA family protein
MSEPLRILVPTDDSPSAQRAVKHVLDLAGRGVAVEVHLLNVQAPVRGVAASIVSAADLESYHRDEAMKVLEGPAQAVTAGGLTPHVHVGVGNPGETVLAFAKRLGCHHIVMGTRGFGGMTGLLMGSVARHVVGEGDLPVTLLR